MFTSCSFYQKSYKTFRKRKIITWHCDNV